MAEQRLFGRSASPGLAQGVVSVLAGPRPPAGDAARAPGPRADERATLLAAIDAAVAELEALAARTEAAARDMVGVQIALLRDEELARPALARVDAGAAALSAWETALAEEISGYFGDGDGDDDAFAARAIDLEDIRDRVATHLTEARAEPVPSGAVLAAADLTLSRFLAIDWARCGAIVLTSGNPASHVAVLARARGVPMVVGVGGAAQAMRGCEALVDAAAGEVVLRPDAATRAAFAARLGRHAAAQSAAARFHAAPAVTADGTRVAMHLNVSALAELDRLDPAGCDGIGLVRTELLFEEWDCRAGAGLPDEDTQFEAYRRIAAWAAGRPAVIRTLDAGGDKQVPGLTPSDERNPFLGLRGLRLSLRHPAALRTQLRAMARAAVHGDVRIMLPMVTVPAELEAARALLAEAMEGLARQGWPARRPPLGIMVEVPAAAVSIDRFAADFFSIGSNDLTQYVTAAGRDSAGVAELADPLNPAVLFLIERVVRHGRIAGREVGLCGDAAAEPRCLAGLLHAGLRSLSVAPAALGRAKQAVAGIDLRRAVSGTRLAAGG